ncbi:MAG: hypothetical protein QM770_00430 [Tepidisphaeraceae bacterium]
MSVSTFARSGSLDIDFGFKSDASKPQNDHVSFELAARQRVAFDGKSLDEKSAASGIAFGVIPTRPMSAATWLNPVTGGVEQRIYPAILHPIPVLRAGHVQTYAEKPDLKSLALDIVAAFEGEAEVHPNDRFALVADLEAKRVVLIELTRVEVPQDKVDDWRVAGSITPVDLIEHIDDPIADRGRAVPTKKPFNLTGSLLFSTRNGSWGTPAVVRTLDVKQDASKKVADAQEPRYARDGTIADRVESRIVELRDTSGKLLSRIELESDVGDDFTLSPDGAIVALPTERFVDVPNDTPRREGVTLFYGRDGRKLGELIGYDDVAFLPDGRQVVTPFGAGEGLFLADYRSGEVKPLTILDGPSDEPKPFWPRQVSVSPDGKWVAYVSRTEAYRVGIDGRNWTPLWLTPNHEPQTWPTFSPDGKYIAITVAALNVMTGPAEVILIDPAAHTRDTLKAASSANNTLPLVWRP